MWVDPSQLGDVSRHVSTVPWPDVLVDGIDLEMESFKMRAHLTRRNSFGTTKGMYLPY